MKRITTLVLFFTFLMSATGRATSVRTVNLLEMVALSGPDLLGQMSGGRRHWCMNRRKRAR